MEKEIFKPGNMIYPVPAVLVSVIDKEGNANLFTVAWTGTICTNPPMAYISVRPERYSYHMLRETGEFVINLTTREMAWALDYCGVRSGRDVDKWKETGLTPVKSRKVLAPLVGESPVNIECRVTEIKELGSHHMFLASVEAVSVDKSYMDGTGRLALNKAGLIAYSHGEYRELGAGFGTFGYSVKRKKDGQKPECEKDFKEKKEKRELENEKGFKHREKWENRKSLKDKEGLEDRKKLKNGRKPGNSRNVEKGEKSPGKRLKKNRKQLNAGT